MTLRCKQPAKRQLSSWNVFGISLLLALSAIGSTSVKAQQGDGAEIPAAPQLKQQTDNGVADSEFRSPMHRKDFQQPQQSGEEPVQGRGGRRLGQFVEGEGPGARDGMPEGGRRFGAGGMGRRGMSGGPGFGQQQMGRGPMGGPGFEPGMGGENRGFAGRHGGMKGGGKFGMPGGLRLDLTSLNLTEEQKQRIKQVREGNRDKARSFRKTLMEKQEQLRSLIFSADGTDAQVRTMRKEVRKAQDSMEELNLDDLLAVRGVLTSEQRQRLPGIAPQQRTAGNQRPAAALSQQQRRATTK